MSGGGSSSYRVDYRYDAFGRLVWRSATGAPVGSGTRLYVHNRSNINREVDLITGQTTEYEYSGVDHPTMSVTRDSAGTVLSSRVYMMDGLGNVVGSATAGSAGGEVIYDSWGSGDDALVDTLRFGFKGMLYDAATGMYNARARWYDPNEGRFLSEDPAGLGGGINQYVFAGDDPINASDPSGMYSCEGVTINADDCGDPLQFPGGSSYGSGSYGGGVSFAGGFGSLTPGVTIGSAVLGLGGEPLLCEKDECARHSVIATLTSGGALNIYQLYMQVTGFAAILRSYVDDAGYLNDPSDGFRLTFTDWRWLHVADVGAIAAVQNAVSLAQSYWNNHPYQLGDSNIFVNQVLSKAGIALSSQQQEQLGWRPTFSFLPREHR